VTARIALDDVVQKGFEELINHKDDYVKIMVTPKKELLV
jgi:(R,R)-butanediol dehydrogenase/meso-butanediol dehydrogenase/diacetyl reductase